MTGDVGTVPGASASSRRRVAVVGAGVAGLTAAYVLQRECDVTLYEAEPRLGGHAQTHDVTTTDGRVVPIDSGFIVHNLSTYPNLLRLFGELDVETQPTDMSMSVRCDGCGLEYAGAKGLSGIYRGDVEFGKLVALLAGRGALEEQWLILRKMRGDFIDHAITSCSCATGLGAAWAASTSISARLLISVAQSSMQSLSSG